MPFGRAALRHRHVGACSGTGADELSVDEVAHDVARTVHRQHQVVELAGHQDGVAANALHRAFHPTLVAVAEAAGQFRIVERPAAILFVAHDAGSADGTAVVGQSIEAHQHLPCDVAIESVRQWRTFVVSRIIIVRGTRFTAAIIDVVVSIIIRRRHAMPAYAGFVSTLIDNAVRVEAEVQEAFCLVHLGRTLQCFGDDLLRNQGIVDVVGKQGTAIGRGMELVESRGIPVVGPGNGSAVDVVLTELLGDVFDAGVGISLAPAHCILVVDAVPSGEDAQADHSSFGVPRGELEQ